MHWDHLEELFKCRLLGPIPITGISNEFPGDAGIPGSGATHDKGVALRTAIKSDNLYVTEGYYIYIQHLRNNQNREKLLC